MDKPVTPRGINHLVINVRDIEESHRFWTEVRRLQGRSAVEAEARVNPPDAVLQRRPRGRDDTTTTSRWSRTRTCRSRPRNGSMFGMPVAINHIAITMPNREAWLQPACVAAAEAASSSIAGSITA